MAVSNTLAKKRTEAFQNVQSASYEEKSMSHDDLKRKFREEKK